MTQSIFNTVVGSLLFIVATMMANDWNKRREQKRAAVDLQVAAAGREERAEEEQELNLARAYREDAIDVRKRITELVSEFDAYRRPPQPPHPHPHPTIQRQERTIETLKGKIYDLTQRANHEEGAGK